MVLTNSVPRKGSNSKNVGREKQGREERGSKGEEEKVPVNSERGVRKGEEEKENG